MAVHSLCILRKHFAVEIGLNSFYAGTAGQSRNGETWFSLGEYAGDAPKSLRFGCLILTLTLTPTNLHLSMKLFVIVALCLWAGSGHAAILSISGNDTLVGNRPLNLIVNGSFEADGGLAANNSYWATGTSFSPLMSLTGWTALGQVDSYAIWGNDGLGGIKGSAILPHGTN